MVGPSGVTPGQEGGEGDPDSRAAGFSANAREVCGAGAGPWGLDGAGTGPPVPCVVLLGGQDGLLSLRCDRAVGSLVGLLPVQVGLAEAHLLERTEALWPPGGLPQLRGRGQTVPSGLPGMFLS